MTSALCPLAGAAALLLVAFPAEAGPPFLTEDPEALNPEEWEIDATVSSTHFRGETSGTAPALEVDYGLMADVELHLVASVAYDRTTGARQFGYGNTELGFKWRFLDEDDNPWGLQVATQPLVEIPTGNSARGIGTGHPQYFLPIWLQKSWGRLRLYGGGGYWTNTGIDQKNFWFSGLVAEYEIGKDWTFGAELFHQTASQAGAVDTTGFNLGLIYDLSRVHHLLLSAGRGLQHATSTNQYSYLVGWQLTF